MTHLSFWSDKLWEVYASYPEPVLLYCDKTLLRQIKNDNKNEFELLSKEDFDHVEYSTLEYYSFCKAYKGAISKYYQNKNLWHKHALILLLGLCYQNELDTEKRLWKRILPKTLREKLGDIGRYAPMDIAKELIPNSGIPIADMRLGKHKYEGFVDFHRLFKPGELDKITQILYETYSGEIDDLSYSFFKESISTKIPRFAQIDDVLKNESNGLFSLAKYIISRSIQELDKSAIEEPNVSSEGKLIITNPLLVQNRNNEKIEFHWEQYFSFRKVFHNKGLLSAAGIEKFENENSTKEAFILDLNRSITNQTTQKTLYRIHDRDIKKGTYTNSKFRLKVNNLNLNEPDSFVVQTISGSSPVFYYKLCSSGVVRLENTTLVFSVESNLNQSNPFLRKLQVKYNEKTIYKVDGEGDVKLAKNHYDFVDIVNPDLKINIDGVSDGISGKTSFFIGYPVSISLFEGNGYSVTLQNELEETIRGREDEIDGFIFDELPKGKYAVKIVDKANKDIHIPEGQKDSFEITSGKSFGTDPRIRWGITSVKFSEYIIEEPFINNSNTLFNGGKWFVSDYSRSEEHFLPDFMYDYLKINQYTGRVEVENSRYFIFYRSDGFIIYENYIREQKDYSNLFIEGIEIIQSFRYGFKLNRNMFLKIGSLYREKSLPSPPEDFLRTIPINLNFLKISKSGIIMYLVTNHPTDDETDAAKVIHRQLSFFDPF